MTRSATLKTLLLATTALMAVSGTALALVNTINIDISSQGSVNSLDITQDATHGLGNVINSNGNPTTGVALPIKGPWDVVSLTQNGSGDAFFGAIKAGGASATASLTASYGGGNNSHSLTVGQTTAPVNPTITVAVTNTDSTANTFIDTLNGTSLSYGLHVNGTNTSVTNSVSATAGITLDQTVNGGTALAANTVGNTVSGVNSFSNTLVVGGAGNSVTNTANGIVPSRVEIRSAGVTV